MTPTLLRATEPDAIMHKDVISHAGIHQEAPFSSRRDSEGGESSRDEGRQARRKVAEETSGRRWLRKDPKEGGIEEIDFLEGFRDGAKRKNHAKT